MKKKEKRILAFALAIGLTVSAFSGIGISFAKGGITQDELEETLDDGALMELPSSENSDVEADVKEEKDIPVNEVVMDQEGQVIHNTENDKSDGNAEDKYNMGETEIKELMDAGYSASDVYQVDDMANELSIPPLEIIQRLKESGKSVQEVRQEYLDEISTTSQEPEQFKKLKEEYPEEYELLQQRGMKEEDILLLLTYLKMNNVSLTDQLIQEFEEKGVELFE